MIDCIKELLKSNEIVYETVSKIKLCGLTENELKEIIINKYKEILGDFTFEGDIVAGKQASIGEGAGTDYAIKKGDAVILDLLPGKNGYFCDTTRTFFCGEATAEQENVYNTVVYALNKTESILKAGIKASEIYYKMKDCLKPYENTFFHHAGHLVGTERLIQPQFLPNNNTELKVGDIVTLEPGIYLKDNFGVRLENNYLITESGYEKLFSYPLDIKKFITGE